MERVTGFGEGNFRVKQQEQLSWAGFRVNLSSKTPRSSEARAVCRRRNYLCLVLPTVLGVSIVTFRPQQQSEPRKVGVVE